MKKRKAFLKGLKSSDLQCSIHTGCIAKDLVKRAQMSTEKHNAERLESPPRLVFFMGLFSTRYNQAGARRREVESFFFAFFKNCFLSDFSIYCRQHVAVGTGN